MVTVEGQRLELVNEKDGVVLYHHGVTLQFYCSPGFDLMGNPSEFSNQHLSLTFRCRESDNRMRKRKVEQFTSCLQRYLDYLTFYRFNSSVFYFYLRNPVRFSAF